MKTKLEIFYTSDGSLVIYQSTGYETAHGRYKWDRQAVILKGKELEKLLKVIKK